MIVAEEERTEAEHEARMWIGAYTGKWGGDSRQWILKQWGQSDRGGGHRNTLHKAKARIVMS